MKTYFFVGGKLFGCALTHGLIIFLILFNPFDFFAKRLHRRRPKQPKSAFQHMIIKARKKVKKKNSLFSSLQLINIGEPIVPQHR